MESSPSPPAALETIDSLAREFQSLPLPSFAPAVVLLLTGLLLLVAGRYFLRSALVIAAIVVGAMLGAPILGGFAPKLGSTMLTLLGGVAGLIIVTATWRLMLGCAAAIVTGFVCASIALIGIDAGLVDARSINDPVAVALEAPERDAHDALVERAPKIIRPLVDVLDSRWQRESSQVKTFLTAAAAGGALVGLVIGTWLPLSCAAVLTSMLGALLALIGGTPLLERLLARQTQGVSPLSWLLLFCALTLLGWLVQTWRGTPEDESQANTKAEPSDNATAHNSTQRATNET